MAARKSAQPPGTLVLSIIVLGGARVKEASSLFAAMHREEAFAKARGGDSKGYVL